MNKLYLLEGENEFLIEKELKKIISNDDDIEIIRYNLDEATIDDVIEDLDTYDMFLKRKVIIAYNPNFYLNVIDNFNLDKFLKYLNNPSDNILILVSKKINNKLKVVKSTIKYFEHIKVNDLNVNTFIKDNIECYKMDNMTINYFLSRVGNDFNNIYHELEKLKAYKLESHEINKEDIDLLCRQNFEENVFDLIDAIVKKEKKKAFNLYNYFLNNGSEVFQILVLLSNQIRLIYNVKILSYLKDNEISNILEVHEYPVKLARGKCFNYSKDELLNLLYNLGKIDEDIKNGKQLPNVSLLSFIMQM